MLGATLSPYAASATGVTISEIKKIAEATSLVERPAKATEILESIPAEERPTTAARVLRLFLARHHSLAPSLVASISKSFPELAVDVASEAIRLFPEHAYSITKAAVASAPERAVAIALMLSSENVSRAEPILAGTLSATPEAAPLLIHALENPQVAERVESQDSLGFSWVRRLVLNRSRGRNDKDDKDDHDDDDDRSNGSGRIDFGELPFQDSLDISRNRRGVWIIEITVPKGRVGNIFVRQLRRALFNLLRHPRLRSKYKIVVNRYTH